MEVTKFTETSMKDKSMITFDKIGNLLDNISLTREERIVANAHASDIFASFTSVKTSELNNSLKLLLNSVENTDVRLALSDVTRNLVVLHTQMTLFKETEERELSLTTQKANISIAKMQQTSEIKAVMQQETLSNLKRVGISIAVSSIAGVLSYYTLKTQKQAVTNILKMVATIFVDPSSPGMCKKTIMKQVTTKAIDENALTIVQKMQKATGFTSDLPLIDVVTNVTEIVDSTDILCAATSYVYNPISETVKYFIGDIPNMLSTAAIKTGNVLVESGNVATDLIIVLFTIAVALVFFIGCFRSLKTSIQKINFDMGSRRKSSRVSRKSKKPIKKSVRKSTRKSKKPGKKTMKKSAKKSAQKSQKSARKSKKSAQKSQKSSKKSSKKTNKSARKSKKPSQKSARKSQKSAKKSSKKSNKPDKKSARKSSKKSNKPDKKSARKSKKPTKKSARKSKKPSKKSARKSKKPSKKSARKSKKPSKKSARKSKKSARKSKKQSKKSAQKSARKSKKSARKSKKSANKSARKSKKSARKSKKSARKSKKSARKSKKSARKSKKSNRKSKKSMKKSVRKSLKKSNKPARKSRKPSKK
jgi:hypothetical protein